tara:strand:- start:79 stop:456 length:378 start_codon:yes stop_codon:yes gene_type:complete
MIFEDYSKIQKPEFSMRKDKVIKVGDAVEVHQSGTCNRFGTITDISIATHKSDIAGELGIRVNSLDLSLGYTGSISFRNDDAYGEKDNKFWCYFYQVVDVYGHDEDQYELHSLSETSVPDDREEK